MITICRPAKGIINVLLDDGRELHFQSEPEKQSKVFLQKTTSEYSEGRIQVWYQRLDCKKCLVDAPYKEVTLIDLVE